jgi:ubiquinone/menaquinone biosynthesis C-methylase UbiE
MSGPAEQASVVGEYDDAMRVLLQTLWGDGFLSPGGPAEVAELLRDCDLRGRTVLDIGAALGAVDELLVREHGAGHVTGIDLDPAMLAQMDERIRRAGLTNRVRSLRVDPGPLPFADDSFDVVFSKDSIVQIPNKPAFFAEVYRVLRPGGLFIASDWCRGGEGEYSAEMREYFRLEGITYNMATLGQTQATLEAVGFTAVEVRDRNAWYLPIAEAEAAQLKGPLRPLMIDRIGPARTEHFIVNWEQLVLVVRRGELRPGHIKALKPS